MFLDQQLIFSDAQSLTTSAASTNVVDLLAQTGGRGRALGTPPGEGFIFMQFTTMVGSTLNVAAQLQGSIDAAFTAFTASASYPLSGVPANPVNVGPAKAFGVLTTNQLNRLYAFPIAPLTSVYAAASNLGATQAPVRFFRINYTVSGATSVLATAGYVLDLETLPGITMMDSP